LELPGADGRVFVMLVPANANTVESVERMSRRRKSSRPRSFAKTSGAYTTANAQWLAKPEFDPNRDQAPRAAAGRAYSSSKLCVVLTARALAARTDTAARRIRVIAYDPGPTPGTGLVRNQGVLVRFVWERLATPLRWVMRKANTIEDAGDALAALALGTIRPPDGRVYGALRRGKLTWPALSELARRDDVMHALWHDSARLVGLSD
jgi:NAD(P)-dependent dehydrogenase (short-subunit alcohol dehydrogenase family)